MHRRQFKTGFSLLELLAVITLIGIISAVVVSRISTQAFDAKRKCCLQYQADLNSAMERYHFQHGSFPSQLSDLIGDYYPEGIPNCPVDNLRYQIDSVSNRVQTHSH